MLRTIQSQPLRCDSRRRRAWRGCGPARVVGRRSLESPPAAGVAKLVDAPALGAGGLTPLGVRVPPPAFVCPAAVRGRAPARVGLTPLDHTTASSGSATACGAGTVRTVSTSTPASCGGARWVGGGAGRGARCVALPHCRPHPGPSSARAGHVLVPSICSMIATLSRCETARLRWLGWVTLRPSARARAPARPDVSA